MKMELMQDTEFYCIKLMYIVAGNDIQKYKNNILNPNMTISNYKFNNPYLLHTFWMRKASEYKIMKINLSTLYKLIYHSNPSQYVSELCDTLLDKYQYAEGYASAAYFTAFCSIWDYYQDRREDRYIELEKIYRESILKYILEAIKSCELSVNLNYSTRINIDQNPDNLPDLIYHDKVMMEINNSIIHPLMKSLGKFPQYTF